MERSLEQTQNTRTVRLGDLEITKEQHDQNVTEAVTTRRARPNRVVQALMSAYRTGRDAYDRSMVYLENPVIRATDNAFIAQEVKNAGKIALQVAENVFIHVPVGLAKVTLLALVGGYKWGRNLAVSSLDYIVQETTTEIKTLAANTAIALVDTTVGVSNRISNIESRAEGYVRDLARDEKVRGRLGRQIDIPVGYVPAGNNAPLPTMRAGGDRLANEMYDNAVLNSILIRITNPDITTAE